jgi:hypothetical protein
MGLATAADAPIIATRTAKTTAVRLHSWKLGDVVI